MMLRMWTRNKCLDLGFTRKENLYFAIAMAIVWTIYFCYTEYK